METNYNYKKMYWAKYHECERLKNILKKYEIRDNICLQLDDNKYYESINEYQSELNRCQAIKKNNKQCKQTNKLNKNNCEIIDGYCKYHKNLRK
jgi:hypothetical protein